MGKLLDVLLFPKDLYKRITDKKPGLYGGIIFVGLVDIVFVLFINYNKLFVDKTQGDLIFNIILSIIFIFGLGIIDVFFFSIPLFDLFKRFKKDGNMKIDRGLLIRLIKVYIVAHFLILPAEILIFYIYYNLNNEINTVFIYLAAIIDLLIPIWFSAAISRGVNVLYNFSPLFKRLAFLAILVWNHLLVYAFSYMIDNWILALFRV